MKSKILIQVVAISLACLVGLTGCKAPWKTGGKTTGKGGTEAPVPPLGPGQDLTIGERPPEGVGTMRGQFTPVYFDYDSAKIKATEVSKLDAVAA
jgi:outer membrane protein OmpA-like peptidoglycan-associated protein